MGMNVLLLNDRLHGGGAERILQLAAADLSSRGHRVTILAPEGNREELRDHYPQGVRFLRLPFWEESGPRFSPGRLLMRLGRALSAALLRLRRWDRVIAMKEGPAMRLAAGLRAEKKLAWVHTDFLTLHWSRFSFRSNEEERRCMARFHRVVCVSETVRRGILETVGDPGNLQLLYNPIDEASVREKARAAVDDAPAAGDGPLLAAVGRLDKGKRFDLLLDVCRDLHRDRLFSLWIIGDGEELETLRKQSADLPFVRLLGRKDNPYPYIARADWLVSASESESYGLIVQEALILGVPVVACACGGVKESLDPRFGLLTGLDRDALREGLARVLSDPGQRERYRAAIRSGYRREELWEPRLEQLRALIEG